MTQLYDDVVRVSRRMIEEKEPYYKDTKKYLNTIMRSANQEDLIDVIMQINIHELKQCLSAGVPGDAMHVANRRLKDLKEEIKAYIEKKGAEASMSVEVEIESEDKKDVVEGIRPSEKRREGDSGEMGETSTNSGSA
jgi:hypothetical protein